MKRHVKLLPFIIGVLVLGACSQTKGYKIEGSAPLPEFEGKMVYMKNVSTNTPLDSAKIVNGKFAFNDTATVKSPSIKILSINTGNMGLEYRLPVVLENGVIRATISEIICTEGTVLNDRMQDFLLAIDDYSTGNVDKSAEQVKSGFSDLLRRYIEINNDNVISHYIKEAYRSSL